MNPVEALAAAGQSVWLDNISRPMIDDGTLTSYINDLAVTGLTSNPTIFQKAIEASDAYQGQIDGCRKLGLSGEETFFALAISDLQRAADLLAGVYRATDGGDGFVSLEVSPAIADDSKATVEQAAWLFTKAARANLFIKIPGTEAGLEAIEEAIYRGLPINVTLLFSAEQYLAAADAYYKGVERRIAEGLSPRVASVASLFVSRWDVAVPEADNRLGLAIAAAAYRAYLDLLDSDRHRSLLDHGGRAQKLLFASTGTKDKSASDILYVERLAAPETINTMPSETLLAYADHGPAKPELLDPEPLRKGAYEVDIDALAGRLQQQGEAAFLDSWHELLQSITTA